MGAAESYVNPQACVVCQAYVASSGETQFTAPRGALFSTPGPGGTWAAD